LVRSIGIKRRTKDLKTVMGNERREMTQDSSDSHRYDTKSLVIIPARGGSKGLPGKNIKLLGGIPLIAWPIQAALAAESVGRVIVSTDSEEIADVAREYGAEVPFLRSPELARDDSTLGDVLNHAIKALGEEGHEVDIQVVLYPTSPFVRPQLIETLVKKCLEGYTHAQTYRRVELDEQNLFYRDADGLFKNLYPENGRSTKSYLRGYGLCSVTHRNASHFNPYCHLIRSPAELVDIDAIEDMYLAEEMVRHGLSSFFEERL
jgi:hypothetical protein